MAFSDAQYTLAMVRMRTDLRCGGIVSKCILGKTTSEMVVPRTCTVLARRAFSVPSGILYSLMFDDALAFLLSNDIKRSTRSYSFTPALFTSASVTLDPRHYNKYFIVYLFIHSFYGRPME